MSLSRKDETRWTHAMCDGCWTRRQGTRAPVRLEPQARVREWCCFCGAETRDGIYARHDPDQTPCQGIHPEPPVEVT